MPIAVTDPIICVRTAAGTKHVGLHEVLTCAHDGTLVDLPGMRVDQRSPVVTTLAILSHLLRRYAQSTLVTSDDWLMGMRQQLGEDALVLAGGPDDKPQFLQPVLVGLGEIKPFNITEADHLMAANRHVLKVAQEATPEHALYSLMCSTWRHHGGVGNPAGARARGLTVLVGDGVTVGSEILSLARAYDAAKPAVVGINAPAPKSSRDHMLWAMPWQTKQPVAQTPYPFIDCRRIRLVAVSNDLLGAVVVAENGTRVDTGTGNIEDPHVPIQVQSGGPYKLALNRVWSYRVQHAAVAGSSDVRTPPILDLAPAYSSVRICGVGFDQGITKGSWEALYRIGRGKKVKLGGATASRLSDLSSRALEAVSEATRAIYGPMITAYGRLDDAKPYLNRAQSHLRDLLGQTSLQLILDLVADNPDTEAEQNALHSMALDGIRTVWRETTATIRDPLAVARASLQLDYYVREKFGGSVMPEQMRSDLAARIHAVLHDMDAHLTPANRAHIRSAATELPLDAWLALAAAPLADMEDVRTRVGVLPKTVHRRQSGAQRQGVNSDPIGVYERVATNVKCFRPVLECLEGGCNIFGSPDFERCDLKAEGAGRCLNRAHLVHGPGNDIGYDRQSTETRDSLAQNIKTLATKFGLLVRQAGDIAARTPGNGLGRREVADWDPRDWQRHVPLAYPPGTAGRRG
jgi:hypothetical protein